jgi:glycosyltransferase involved in cell wall biosynthesis
VSDGRQIIFVGEYDFPDGDAAATRTLSLARICRDLGYRVTVMGKGTLRPEHFREDLGEYEFEGIQYRTMNPERLSTLRRLLSPIKRLTLYVSRLEKFDPATVKAVVINASGSAMHVPAVSAYCRRVGIPLIADVCEWYDPRQFPRGRLDPFYAVFTVIFHLVFPRLRNMIVVSKLLERQFADPNRNLVRIASPFDVRKIPCEDRSPSDRRLFMYAGSPGTKDQLREIILAFASLSPGERAGVEFRVIGATEIELRRFLGHDAGALDALGSTVTPMGRISRESVLAELQRAHFTFLVRPNERYANAGFPSKVAESLAAGVPVILNFTSDLEDFLGDGNAVVVVKGNSTSAIADAIRRALALSTEELRALRRGARTKAESIFDYRRDIDTFRTLLGKAR